MKPAASVPLYALSAVELARRIAAREVSCVETTQAHINRCRCVNPLLNAIAVPLYESALRAAEKADESIRRGEPLGPLHGVPISIKECFDVEGTDSTMGLDNFVGQPRPQDGPLVARLRRAGAIILGKTNVPQLLLMHECDNPVYGLTRNPFDKGRSPGGSTGGGAALTAAGGTPWTLGDDLGGSIRQPAHSVGIAGFKPTGGILSQTGVRGNGRGLGMLQPVPGLLARSTQDLVLGLKVLAEHGSQPAADEVGTLNLTHVDLGKIRVGRIMDDGYLAPFAEVTRAVDMAARGLQNANVEIIDFKPPQVDEAVTLFFAIMGANGGGEIERLLGTSRVDARIERLLRLGRMPHWQRVVLARALETMGAKYQGQLLRNTGRQGTLEIAGLLSRLNAWRERFSEEMQRAQLDALLLAPHSTVALRHGYSAYLPMAAAACYLFNLLDFPAGVVPVTYVADRKNCERLITRDRCESYLRDNEANSAGLPVGVQIAAPRFADGLVLQLLQVVEDHCQFKQRACIAPAERMGQLRSDILGAG